MEKAVGKTILKVPQWHTLEMKEGNTRAIFTIKGKTVKIIYAQNLAQKTKRAWLKVARLVLLGPNYTPRGGVK
ncbi:MAG: hypothetical protein ACP5RX_00130 [Minisyncoccia bacterium]